MPMKCECFLKVVGLLDAEASSASDKDQNRDPVLMGQFAALEPINSAVIKLFR